MFKGKLLGKSFDPEKCKLHLKLAVARINLLRSKRQAVVNQLRSDIAHLLELGQDQTALLQVEHVIKEEKAVAAYDILSVFCEHIVPNLHTIVSQRNCPTDLKDAIASVIFASGRCGDIPELQKVCKCFETKYGRKFVTSACELHPNCGVYLTLIEKLSTRPPEGKIKLKTLIDIAKEHDIKWDPKSYGEDLDPLGDILGGYSYSDIEGTRNKAEFQIKHEGIPNQVVTVCVESCQSDAKHHQLNISVTLPNTTSSGMELKRVTSGDGNINVQNRKMEFSDATTAARVAAEAAERASKAARQAVELSIRGKFTEEVGAADILNEMNVKRQEEEKKCSYDYDVVSTNSYTATEGDSNADLANQDPTVFDECTSQEDREEESKLGYYVRKSPMIFDDETTRPIKERQKFSPTKSIPYYDFEDDDPVGNHVWGSANK